MDLKQAAENYLAALSTSDTAASTLAASQQALTDAQNADGVAKQGLATALADLKTAVNAA